MKRNSSVNTRLPGNSEFKALAAILRMWHIAARQIDAAIRGALRHIEGQPEPPPGGLPKTSA